MVLEEVQRWSALGPSVLSSWVAGYTEKVLRLPTRPAVPMLCFVVDQGATYLPTYTYWIVHAPPTAKNSMDLDAVRV